MVKFTSAQFLWRMICVACEQFAIVACDWNVKGTYVFALGITRYTLFHKCFRVLRQNAFALAVHISNVSSANLHRDYPVSHCVCLLSSECYITSIFVREFCSKQSAILQLFELLCLLDFNNFRVLFFVSSIHPCQGKDWKLVAIFAILRVFHIFLHARKGWIFAMFATRDTDSIDWFTQQFMQRTVIWA